MLHQGTDEPLALGPNISSDAEHLFQSDANIAQQKRRLEKQSLEEQPGNPLNAGSKILAILVSDGGNAVYLAESGFVARKMDLAEGKTLRLFKGHLGPVTCLGVYLDKDGAEVLLTGSWDKSLKLWTSESKDARLTLTGHSDFVKCLAIGPGGNVAWSGSSDSTIREWDLTTGECIRTLQGHSRAVEDLKLCEDGKKLYSCSSDRSIRKWDARTGTEVFVFEGHLTSVYALFLHEGDLWSASADKTARRWDLETMKEDSSYEHPDFVKCVQIFGPYLITGSRDETIRVFDIATGKCIREIEGHYDEVSCMTVVGKILITGSLDGTLRRWSISDILNINAKETSKSIQPPPRKSKGKKESVQITAEEEAELAELMSDDDE